ncbi:hypothetical protein AJ79_08203 [Helicocarpus griseus UAMH5409]|uniref:DASH complex subunit SPC34 n=1 Tax=Helicocarpus griseus UAMH5409 TaxID=1447875 RepID=A0A2B7WV23_9EURO|nr:hypothetical protein AJ79_08203 [Helicocarpus griseus UAMH5409]
MGLLESHLEQISLSSAAISDLPFPPPKIFANALLQPHDITTLIRDTEPHERALFSVDPSSSRHSQRRATRRATTAADIGSNNGGGDSMASRIYAAKHNKNQSAVAQVLGGDMMDQIKRSTGVTSSSTSRKGEINVEVLLRGAEMLCNVYPISGATEKIASLRQRHYEVSKSIAHLESRIAEQSAQLERMNRSQSYDYDMPEPVEPVAAEPAVPDVSEEDLQREMQEIRELEMRKRRLEDRVTGMERDLGGLMR